MVLAASATAVRFSSRYIPRCLRGNGQGLIDPAQSGSEQTPRHDEVMMRLATGLAF